MRERTIKQQIWLNQQEKNLLKKKAKKVVLTESEFLRSCIKGYKIKEQPTKEIREFNKDIKIIYSGLRPGEKLYEELLMAEEGLQETAHSLIHIGKPLAFDEEEYLRQLEELKKIVKMEPEAICRRIKEIVPTYQPKNMEE